MLRLAASSLQPTTGDLYNRTTPDSQLCGTSQFSLVHVQSSELCPGHLWLWIVRRDSTTMPIPTGASRLSELTAIISSNTKTIEQYFANNDLPSLSFDVDATRDFPVASTNEEIQKARRAVVNATQELHDLMVGPREHLRWMAWSVCIEPLRCDGSDIFFLALKSFIAPNLPPRKSPCVSSLVSPPKTARVEPGRKTVLIILEHSIMTIFPFSPYTTFEWLTSFLSMAISHTQTSRRLQVLTRWTCAVLFAMQ